MPEPEREPGSEGFEDDPVRVSRQYLLIVGQAALVGAALAMAVFAKDALDLVMGILLLALFGLVSYGTWRRRDQWLRQSDDQLPPVWAVYRS